MDNKEVLYLINYLFRIHAATYKRWIHLPISPRLLPRQAQRPTLLPERGIAEILPSNYARLKNYTRQCLHCPLQQCPSRCARCSLGQYHCQRQ
jgi:hypothetical protein